MTAELLYDVKIDENMCFFMYDMTMDSIITCVPMEDEAIPAGALTDKQLAAIAGKDIQTLLRSRLWILKKLIKKINEHLDEKWTVKRVFQSRLKTCEFIARLFPIAYAAAEDYTTPSYENRDLHGNRLKLLITAPLSRYLLTSELTNIIKPHVCHVKSQNSRLEIEGKYYGVAKEFEILYTKFTYYQDELTAFSTAVSPDHKLRPDCFYFYQFDDARKLLARCAYKISKSTPVNTITWMKRNRCFILPYYKYNEMYKETFEFIWKNAPRTGHVVRRTIPETELRRIIF